MYSRRHTYIHIYIYIPIHIYTRTHIYTHTHTHTQSFINTYTHIYIHTHLYTHTHRHTHIWVRSYTYKYTYIYIHTHTHRYHTITDVYTTALLLTKPSSDDDSGFWHGFGAEASLPLTQRAPAVSHNTTRVCQIVVALWDCQIHADADGGSPRLVKKTEVELAIKSLRLTSKENTFVIQPFLTHRSCRSSYFVTYADVPSRSFLHKGPLN